MKKKISWIVGALSVSLLTVVLFTVVGKTAISELAGIAVAQSSTSWKNVKDAALGDNLVDGILASALMMYDGTNFDRARGDTTFGLDVDVTRLPGGGQTPADAFVNPTTFQGSWSLTGLFNGTTWDRWRGQVSPVQGVTLLNTRTVSAANTAIATTLTGAANTRVHVYSISARCAGGSSFITITDGGTTIYDTDGGTVPAGTNLYEKEWGTGLTGTTAASMVVTLAACGSGNIGVLSVQADRF